MTDTWGGGRHAKEACPECGKHVFGLRQHREDKHAVFSKRRAKQIARAILSQFDVRRK